MTLPTTPVEFQNAKAASVPPEGPNLTMQPKLDGWRMAFYVDGPGQVRSYTRTLKSQMGKTPALDAEFAARFPAGTVVDGEIVAMKTDDQGRVVNDFKWVAEVMGSGAEKAASRQRVARRPLQFVAFDILYWAGVDVRHMPYGQRLEILRTHLADNEISPSGRDLISVTVSVPSSLKCHEAIVAAGYEGTVVKDLDSPYASGERGKGWTKIKVQPTVDVVVLGFEEGKGKYADTIGAVIFGQPDASGAMVERGRCSGMDDGLRYLMGADRDRFIGTVIEVAHMGLTSGGNFRHPQFKRLRDDRLASSVVWHNG